MNVGIDEYENYTANIGVKFLREGAKLPHRGSEQAAGYDLYAVLDSDNIKIKPGETVKIGTGIAIDIPDNYFGGIFARSGLATKKGLRPVNCVGVCDADFVGEIIVALHNDSSETQTVENGERIAQLVIIPFLPVEFEQVEHLSDTKRGSGGFGSTGTK